MVRARPRAARLWALEEALRSPGLAAALAEVEQLSLTQSRRLQLAAEAKGVTALLLRPPRRRRDAERCRHALADRSGAQRGGSRATAGVRPPALADRACVRCRGGRTGSWHVVWHEDGWHEVPDSLALAAGPGDRPAAAARPGAPPAGVMPACGPRAAARHLRQSPRRAPARGAVRARPGSGARARHDAGRCPGDGAGAPGACRRARGRCQAARGPRRLVRALYALRRARSQPRACRRRRRSGSTSPAAPICSAARRRCARICSPVSRRQGLAAAAAIADTPGAAWAVARLRRGNADRAAGRHPGGAGAFAGGGAPPRRPMPSRCWSASGSSGSRASIPCRAGRWSRASATRSPRVSIRPRARSSSRSRRARRRRRIAPSWRFAEPIAQADGAGAGDPAPARRAVQRPRGREPRRTPADARLLSGRQQHRARSRSAPAGRAAIARQLAAPVRREARARSISASASSARSWRPTWSSRCCPSRSPGGRWARAISTRRAIWRRWSTG